MKISKLVFTLGLAGSLLTACGQSSDVAATIDGKPITMNELDKAFGGKVGEQIYNMRKSALDNILEQKILEKAAADKKLSVDDFLKQEVNSKVSEPTEAEIKAIYEANKDNYGDSFEKVKPNIADALKRNRKNIQQSQLIADLKGKMKIESKLVKPPVQRAQVSAGDSPSIGPDGAKVLMVEFSDFQCPFCGRARATVFQIIDTYKDKLKYVFRDFPLSFHQYAMSAHLASHCAYEQSADKYWDYYKKLFSSQQALQVKDLKGYAKELGLNTKQFDECLDSKKYEAAVQKNVEEASKVGVSGTPAFFINGIPLSGAQPFANFKEIIDEELKK